MIMDVHIPVEKLLLKQATVAKMIDLSVRTLERMRAAGTFPQPDLKFGTKLLYKRETIVRWIESQARR